MSQLFPESPLRFLPNDVLAAKEAVSQGTGTMQQSLLSSPDSGMIVFSSSARILHMNGPARALMALFGDSHELWPQMAPESMPSFLTEFCRDVLAQLHSRVETEDWAQFEMRRICHMITPSLLLRGFGVPYSANHELLIILTLDPLLSLPHPGNSPAYLQSLAPMPSDLARTHA